MCGDGGGGMGNVHQETRSLNYLANPMEMKNGFVVVLPDVMRNQELEKVLEVNTKIEIN